MTAADHAATRARVALRMLPLRIKVLVVVAAPLWLPVALAAWLEHDG